ncbi:MAG: hypothetical protein OQK24_02195 [Magnetovibrio sp.]|nr:hypothetical protein [Magnetovibrio sp.]
MHYKFAPLIAVLVLGLSACQTTGDQVVMSKKSALELRNIQSRIFETSDQSKIYRSVITVMQDLGYAITTVEPEAGIISGNKLAKLDLTAAVSQKDENSTRVRANAIVRVQPNFPAHQVDGAEFYQQRFFEPLAQALFLDALYDDEEIEDSEKVAEGPKQASEVKE